MTNRYPRAAEAMSVAPRKAPGDVRADVVARDHVLGRVEVEDDAGAGEAVHDKRADRTVTPAQHKASRSCSSSTAVQLDEWRTRVAGLAGAIDHDPVPDDRKWGRRSERMRSRSRNRKQNRVWFRGCVRVGDCLAQCAGPAVVRIADGEGGGVGPVSGSRAQAKSHRRQCRNAFFPVFHFRLAQPHIRN